MPAWFEIEPSVFQDEKARLEGLGFVLDGEKLTRDRVVEFNGRSVADPKRTLKVAFPEGYPSFPPEVYDQTDQPLLRRHHHPQNRAFCLFGPARSRWDCGTMTAVDAVNEAEHLIRTFGPDSVPDLENEVPEPVSDLLPIIQFGGFLVPPEIADGLDTVAAEMFGTCQLILGMTKDAPVRGIIKSVKLGEHDWRISQPYERLMQGQPASVHNAAFFRLTRTPPHIVGKEGFRTWMDLVPTEHRTQRKHRPYEWLVFAYPEESGAANAHGVSCTVLQAIPGGHACYRAFLLSQRHAFARIPGLEPLAAKSVVLLGVGALGSRIAQILAASGIQKFHLVDRDAYDSANAVRHACGIRFFGQPKVSAVGWLISESNPNAHITGQIARVGSMGPAEQDQLVARLVEADLVIDATASEHAAHWLDHQCYRLSKPRLHATVTNGAWGGDVMRIIPGKTPCWVCQQVAHEMPAAEPRREGGFYAPGCAQPSFTGNMAEVGVVADIAAAMAIETLLDSQQRDFSGSHVRWFARSASGAWSPRIEVVTSQARPQCPFCPPALKPSGMSS